MSERIGNEDMLINFSNTVGPPDLVYTVDVGTATPGVGAIFSTKVKAMAKMVCVTCVKFIWSLIPIPPSIAPQLCPYTSLTYNFISGGGTVFASATKVKAEGQPVMRLGDIDALPFGTGCVGSWSLMAAPFTVVACGCDIEISSAGQIKSKAN